jgi:hypothetical protein
LARPEQTNIHGAPEDHPSIKKALDGEEKKGVKRAGRLEGWWRHAATSTDE